MGGAAGSKSAAERHSLEFEGARSRWHQPTDAPPLGWTEPISLTYVFRSQNSGGLVIGRRYGRLLWNATQGMVLLMIMNLAGFEYESHCRHPRSSLPASQELRSEGRLPGERTSPSRSEASPEGAPAQIPPKGKTIKDTINKYALGVGTVTVRQVLSITEFGV